MPTKMVPTGVNSLDSVIGGGFPAGSFVLLSSSIGAGGREFLMTSSIMTTAIKKGMARAAERDVLLPDKTWWITFTRSPDDILEEVSLSFERDLYNLFREGVKFKDFSEDYFMTSPVPIEWISTPEREKRSKERLEALGDAFAGIHRAVAAPATKPKTVLESLADFLTEHASSNAVVLYNLSDLARLYSDSDTSWYDFTLFLRGLQRAAKKWNCVIYAPIVSRMLNERQEEEMSACADGVINLEWESTGMLGRRRVMYFRKFRGLLPRIDRSAVLKFEVTITPTSGFEVARAELIEGLR